MDHWLKARGLDVNGRSPGDLHAGGNPRFNERTGELTDRLKFIYEAHPEARQACAPDAGG